MKHCWHLPDVRVTTGWGGEDRQYQCCHCGKKVLLTPEYRKSEHGKFAPDSARGHYVFTLPDDECSQIDAGDDGTLKNNEEKRIDAVSMREACGIHMDVDLSSKKGAGDVGK